MFVRTPPMTTPQRLSEIAAQLRQELPKCKPKATSAAEQKLIAARDARAALSPNLTRSMDRDRLEGRQGSSRETRELQAAQAQSDTAIRERKAELEATRVEFRALVDVAAEPHLRTIDDALTEAAAIISAAAEALKELEKFRVFNGVAVSPSRWRASRDCRHLVAVAKEIAG
jgi:hypothetical protein